MTTKKSQNPAYPDALPTAPGGMSRSALIKELIDEHGYDDGPEWTDVPWPDLIDLVVDERLEAEAPEAPEDEAEEIEEAEAERPEPDDADEVERIETEEVDEF